MTEPNSEPRASRIGRWLRRLALAVLLLVWLAGTAICVGVYRDPRWGLDARVSITGVCLVFALLLTLLWFCCCTRYRWQLRLGVLGAVLAVGLLLPALFRVEQVTGYLAPTLRLRWQPHPDQRLEQPSSLPETASVVDLATTTPYDFPQFLGPERNLAVNKPDLPLRFADWHQRPPRCVWKQPIGAGWSAFVAVNGYAVTMEQRGDQELTTCYEIASGQLMWSSALAARHETIAGGVGPRSTPTIHQGRVYCLGATGILRCLDGTNGRPLWQHDLQQEFGVQQESSGVAWGRAASPLIAGDLVVVPAGGPADGAKSSLVAYDRITGREVWRGGNHQVSYASPALATLAGVAQILIVLEDHVCGHDPSDGRQLWEYAWPGKSTSNASCCQAMACAGDRVFVSKGYGLGSALLQIRRDDSNRWTAEELWQSPSVMKTKFSNVVVDGEVIYGLDDVLLECLELNTGKRLWKRGRYGYGQILRVGPILLVQSESGAMAAVALDPTQYVEVTRFQALEGKTWNTICVYERYLLVRNAEEAACYDLTLDEPTAGAVGQRRANSAMISVHWQPITHRTLHSSVR